MANSHPASKALQRSAADWNRPTDAAGLQVLGQQFMPQIEAAMPSFLKDSGPRFLRSLMTVCSGSPGLMQCAPKDLFAATVQVALLGLELGGPIGQAYLIPFKGKPQLIIGYKGFLALAFRSGAARRITPRVVYVNDDFRITMGEKQTLHHIPNLDDPGPVRGYYAAVETTTGGFDFEYLSKSQAEQHRKNYAMMQNGGPWVKNFDEMALKTCIRKLCKRIPFSVELTQAAGLDEHAEYEVPQELPVLDDPATGTPLVGDDPGSLQGQLIEAGK